MCGREGPESPELPLRELPGCLPRIVPGEIKVPPSDGREMAKRLVVGPEAAKRFFEFLTVPIRNKNTRIAYSLLRTMCLDGAEESPSIRRCLGERQMN